MNGQTNIFEMLYENYKIKTPIKMIELFAGYGATSFAWKYLNIPFEHHKICEWAVNSIQAYKDAHMPNDNNDYSKDKTKEELIEILYKYGISSNYNEPMKYEQIARMSEFKIRTIYNNIIGTHNLVNIQNVKADDLEIHDTKHFTYLLTYSFPCQDLSNVGKRKGYNDTTTRSGMLWEVERILSECKELPQILIMENVPQVKSEANLDSWNKWLSRLEEFSYKNYFKDLSATDYGIPQSRVRCFMVSILGNYNYIFPKPIKLKYKMKDFLEDSVNKQFYLDEERINYWREHEQKMIERGNGFRFNLTNGDSIAKTITTKAGTRMEDNYIDERYYLSDKMKKYIFSKNSKYKVNDGSLVLNREIACTKTTREGQSRADSSDYLCSDVGENYKIKGNENLRIRKLTPKECFRLMGVKDEDFERIARHQSNASLYHLAGDSIVVDVIKAIYGQLI